MHLWGRYLVAEEKGDTEAMKGIKRVIDREEGARMWYFINRVTDDQKSGGILRIERYVNRKLEVNTKQEDMMCCIQEEMEYRFLLVHSAKITGTTLAEKLGYLSDVQVTEALFTGEMEIPDNANNVTALVLTEISRLGIEFLAGNGEKIVVSPDEFKRYWKQACEKTNSSMSLVHFGHYKAATTRPK